MLAKLELSSWQKKHIINSISDYIGYVAVIKILYVQKNAFLNLLT